MRGLLPVISNQGQLKHQRQYTWIPQETYGYGEDFSCIEHFLTSKFIFSCFAKKNHAIYQTSNASLLFLPGNRFYPIMIRKPLRLETHLTCSIC